MNDPFDPFVQAGQQLGEQVAGEMLQIIWNSLRIRDFSMPRARERIFEFKKSWARSTSPRTTTNYPSAWWAKMADNVSVVFSTQIGQLIEGVEEVKQSILL